MDMLVVIVLSFGAAAFGTIVGAGGAFLFVPVMYFLYPDMKAGEMTFLGLCMAFANAVSATVSYARLRRIDVRSGVSFGLATVVPAILGVLLVRQVGRDLFAPLFGGLMIFLAGLIFLRVKKRRMNEVRQTAEGGFGWVQRAFVDSMGVRHNYEFSLPLGLTLSGLVGFVSSFFGIGGGVIHVPMMIHVLRFPVHVATATSILVLAVSTMCGIITHLAAGNTVQHLELALCAAFGAILGAQVGARLSHKFSSARILMFLAIALAAVGVRMLWEATR